MAQMQAGGGKAHATGEWHVDRDMWKRERWAVYAPSGMIVALYETKREAEQELARVFPALPTLKERRSMAMAKTRTKASKRSKQNKRKRFTDGVVVQADIVVVAIGGDIVDALGPVVGVAVARFLIGTQGGQDGVAVSVDIGIDELCELLNCGDLDLVEVEQVSKGAVADA